MSYVNDFLSFLNNGMNNLGPNGWAVVSAIVLAVGFLCMRGFGSRSNY